MSFKDDLKAAREIPRDHEDVDVVLNGNIHTLRFTASDPAVWAEAMDKNPPRPGIAIDMYGFNLRGTVRTLAPSAGALMVDGKPQKLQVDPIDPSNRNDPNRVDEWADLLGTLSGRYIQKIGDAIFRLNVFAVDQELEKAKKKLKRSARISNSPSASE